MNIPLDGLPPFLKRAQKDWEHIAGETLDVEFIKGTLYGYGSELAVLRLEHKGARSAGGRGGCGRPAVPAGGKYKSNKARAFYSKNLNTWTFALD